MSGVLDLVDPKTHFTHVDIERVLDDLIKRVHPGTLKRKISSSVLLIIRSITNSEIIIYYHLKLHSRLQI